MCWGEKLQAVPADITVWLRVQAAELSSEVGCCCFSAHQQAQAGGTAVQQRKRSSEPEHQWHLAPGLLPAVLGGAGLPGTAQWSSLCCAHMFELYLYVLPYSCFLDVIYILIMIWIPCPTICSELWMCLCSSSVEL